MVKLKLSLLINFPVHLYLYFELLFLKKIFEICSEPSGHQAVILYDIWIVIIKRQII